MTILAVAIAFLLGMSIGGAAVYFDMRPPRPKAAWCLNGVVLPMPDDPRWKKHAGQRFALGRIGVTYSGEVSIGSSWLGELPRYANALRAASRAREVEEMRTLAQKTLEGES